MAYLLFFGDVYYPSGGANDLVGSFDSVESAMNHPIEDDWLGGQWANILSLDTLKIVKYFSRGEWKDAQN